MGAGTLGAGTLDAGALGAEVLRRATDPNDPDGAFMDGYVVGRLTGQAETSGEMAAAAAPVGDDSHDDDVFVEWSGESDHTWDQLNDDMRDDW